MFAWLALIPALVPAVLTQSVDVRGYSNAVGCNGGFFHNNNTGNVCVTFPTGFHASAQWVGLPPNTEGQGYIDHGCLLPVFQVFGPGDPCHSTGGQGFDTLNWFNRTEQRRSVAEDVTCQAPTGFVYTAADGRQREIAVKDEGHAGQIANLYLMGDFNGLALH